MTGKKHCFAHSPAKGAERAAARKLGGLHRQTRHGGNPSNIPEQVRTLADVLLILDYTLKEIAALENGINRGRALIALAEAYIKALQVSELEARIAALEAVQHERKS